MLLSFQELTHSDSHIVGNSQSEFTILALEPLSTRVWTVGTRFSSGRCVRSGSTHGSRSTWTPPRHVLSTTLTSRISSKGRVYLRQIKSCSQINGLNLQLTCLPTTKELLGKLLSLRSRNWVGSGLRLAMLVRSEGIVHVSISVMWALFKVLFLFNYSFRGFCFFFFFKIKWNSYCY